MVATPQIGRKLTHKRNERRFISRAVQQIATPAPPPAPLSLAEFDAELDALAEGSENRPAPTFALKPLPPRTALTGAEWQQAYQEWTQSHAQGLSGLTPDMLRREHLYDDDEDV